MRDHVAGALLLSGVLLASWLFVSGMFSQRHITSTRATHTCFVDEGPDDMDRWTYNPFAVDQVVLVLIDALTPAVAVGGSGDRARASFTYLRDELFKGDGTDAGVPFSDALGFVSVADAPTTTSQRLKAITTGSIPAFIDAGSNFNSDAVEEDSIVGQLNGTASILGDDTWLRLFPRRDAWRHVNVFPSFDVRDLDTVDNGILATINDALAEGGGTTRGERAKLVVAHFLGVDHAGHSFHATHEALHAKVRQLNVALRNITNVLRARAAAEPEAYKRTLLVVMGDHGMTASGDHGGSAPAETDTFLFAQLFASPAASWRDGGDAARAAAAADVMLRHARRRVESCSVDDLCRIRSSYPFCSTGGDDAARPPVGWIHQIDLVPTLATMLDVPTPFSNAGRVIPEVLALAAKHSAELCQHIDAETCAARIEYALTEAMRCNVAQLDAMLDHVPGGRAFARGTAAPPPTTLSEHWAWAGEMAAFTRRAFAAMDEPALWTATAAALVVALHGLPLLAGEAEATVAWAVSPLRCGVALCVAGAAWGAARTGTATGLHATALAVTVALAAVFSRTGVILRSIGAVVSHPVRRSVLLLMVYRCGTSFSNSFIVDEEAIVLYLLGTALFVRWYTTAVAAYRSRSKDGQAQQQQQSSGFVLTVGLALAARVALYAGQRDRSFEEERMAPASPLRIAINWGLAAVDTEGETALDAVRAAVWGAFRFAVYESTIVHVVMASGVAVAIALRRLRIVHRRTALALSLLVLLSWALCLGVAEAALPRLALVIFACIYVTRVATGADSDARLRASAVVTEPTAMLLLDAATLHMAAWAWLYASGQQTMFTAIDWHAAFVGMPAYSMAAGAVLVFTNTAMPVFIVVAAVVARARWAGNPRTGARLLAMLTALQVLHLAVATVSLAQHRRHLMAYEIFMPYYVFVLGMTLAHGVAWAVLSVVLP